MLSKEDDFAYCCDPECEESIKIISSSLYQSDHHNGHKTKRISKLRAELMEIDDDTNPMRFISTTSDKEDLITYTLIFRLLNYLSISLRPCRTFLLI